MAVKSVTEATFKSLVLDEPNHAVLVDFWAEWCGPCRMLSPIVEATGEKLKDKLTVYKLNTDTEQALAQKYQITSIPCCILFKKGQEIHRIIGHKPQVAFEAEILNAIT